MSLAIKKNSWHYKLHSHVRAIWGWEPAPNERWSLCPYFHATVWGSVLTMIAFPFSLTGWLLCKLIRKAYKIGAKTPALSFFADFIDNTKFSDLLDQASDNFCDAPMIEGLKWFFISLAVLSGICVVALLVAFVAMGGIYALPKLPEVLYSAIIYAGYGIFMACGFLGLVFLAILEAVVDASLWSWDQIVSAFSWCVGVFSSKELWLDIGKYTGILVGLIAALWITAVLGMLALASKAFSRFLNWCSIQKNGYVEAREVRSELKLEMIKAKEPEPETEPEPKPETKPGSRFSRKIGKITADIIEFIIGVSGSIGDGAKATGRWLKSFYATTKIQKSTNKEGVETSREVRVLGPLGVIVQFLVNFKKGVCPMLEFVDEENLEDKPKENTDKAKNETKIDE